MKTAIKKSSNWGDLLKRLEQTYPVYETVLSVVTEIQELPSLFEFPQLPVSQSLERSWKSSWGVWAPPLTGLESLTFGS